MADIQFTSEIKLDTSAAEKSIANLSKQIDSIFDKTKTMMSGAIKNNKFAFGEKLNDYWYGINAIDSLIDLHTPNQLGKKPTKAQQAAYTARMKSVDAAINQRNRLMGLANFMEKLSRYDNLYDDIVSLRKSVVGGTIESEKGLGRYNVKQRYANNLLGLLYGSKWLYPDIVTEDALEISEKHRDRNRKTGSQSRSELRYTQDKEYWKKAYERARNYMLLDSGDTLLNQLNEIYGMGMEPTVKTKPSSVNQKAKDLMTTWAEAGIAAQRHKDALDAGNLSKADRAYHIAGYKESMNQFIKLQQKLFPEEKTIAENLKKLNKSALLSFGGGPGGTGGIFAGNVAAQGIIKLAGAAEDMLESYWGQSITRNVWASNEAYYHRWKVGGNVTGGILGGVAGYVGGGLLGGLISGASAGAAGGAAAGAAGTAWSGPAAALGAAIIGALGAIGGGIYGAYQSTHAKSDYKSATDMMNRIRNKTLWGSGYNTYFAKAITDMGIANGEAAMGGLADRSMSMSARMMLGQVGEQEMLYLSMMPNYYAALMGGVTGPELMRIYQRDLEAIGDPSMKYLVGQAIGNTEAFATANSPYFNKLYAGTSSRFMGYEKNLAAFEGGYAAARIEGVGGTLDEDYKEINRTIRRARQYYYNEGEESLGYSDVKRKGDNFTIIVNIDGEEIKRDSRSADQVYVNDLQMYTVGG